MVLRSVGRLGVGGLGSISHSTTTYDYGGSGGSRARRDSRGGGTIARKNGREGDASAAILPAEQGELRLVSLALKGRLLGLKELYKLSAEAGSSGL